MNTTNPPTSSASPGDEFSHLESDLLPLLADLDRLACIERTADSSLEDRVMQSSLGALHGVQPVIAQAAELGAIDRASAPQDLEQSVYDASVPALPQAAPRLVVHPGRSERGEDRHIRTARRAWWASAPVRMAALVAVVAGVAVGIRSTYTTPKPMETAADRVNRDMDTLFAVVEHAVGETKNTDATPDYDPDKLSEWLSEGSAS
jgi:hypothetical protein